MISITMFLKKLIGKNKAFEICASGNLITVV
jgi:enoyl-CoA hydratase/carnithine racemase